MCRCGTGYGGTTTPMLELLHTRAQGEREGQTFRLEKDETLLREERDREVGAWGRDGIPP